MRLAIAAFTICAFAASAAAGSVSNTCTSQKSDIAAKAVYDIGDWYRLYRFYASYGSCENGSAYIVDGVSDRVADLLVSQWRTFDTLLDAIKLHPPYATYVLSHIDRVMTADQAGIVLDNARNHCPAGGEAMCEAIVKRVLRFHPED